MTEEQDKEICKVCGRCCELLLVPTRFMWSDEDSKLFYRTRGMTIVEDRMNGITLVLATGMCPKWKLGEGCTIYDNKPYWCDIYEPKNDPFHASMCPLCPEFDGMALKNKS